MGGISFTLRGQLRVERPNCFLRLREASGQLSPGSSWQKLFGVVALEKGDGGATDDPDVGACLRSHEHSNELVER
jgi:hypothetical protein